MSAPNLISSSTPERKKVDLFLDFWNELKKDGMQNSNWGKELQEKWKNWSENKIIKEHRNYQYEKLQKKEQLKADLSTALSKTVWSGGVAEFGGARDQSGKQKSKEELLNYGFGSFERLESMISNTQNGLLEALSLAYDTNNGYPHFNDDITGEYLQKTFQNKADRTEKNALYSSLRERIIKTFKVSAEEKLKILDAHWASWSMEELLQFKTDLENRE